MSDLWKHPFICRNYAEIRENQFNNEYIFLDYLINKLKNRNVALDLCCGIGLHAEYFSTKMNRVIGIDSSSIMIEYANRRKQSNVELIEGDILHYNINEKIDLIGFFYGSLIFPDAKLVEKVIAKSIQHLDNEGILVIDNRNFNFMKKLLGTRSWVEREEHYELQEYLRLDDSNLITTITNYVFKNQIIDNFNISLDARYYQVEELKQILNYLDMDIIETLGDYDMSPYDLRDSPRMILICQRRRCCE